MATVVARHKVGNFETWLKGHQERVALFAPAVTSFKTFQDGNDPNSVLLVIEVTDMEMLGGIINNPKYADVKARHTVIEPITVSMQVAV